MFLDHLHFATWFSCRKQEFSFTRAHPIPILCVSLTATTLLLYRQICIIRLREPRLFEIRYTSCRMMKVYRGIMHPVAWRQVSPRYRFFHLTRPHFAEQDFNIVSMPFSKLSLQNVVPHFRVSYTSYWDIFLCNCVRIPILQCHLRSDVGIVESQRNGGL